ncbi:MAG TPA: hypothetical protein VFC78_04010 [Tepidisphaeraceae bacterium]|nr:hypothetical protein [Tepidisphaeraceae bacterium]
MATLITNNRPADASLGALVDGKVVEFSSIEEKIEALAEAWREDNLGRSVVNYFHPAYLKIIGLGMAAVPHLLREVAQGSRVWFLALEQIVGYPVHLPEMKGDLAAVAKAWIDWGTFNGYSPIQSGPQSNKAAI